MGLPSRNQHSGTSGPTPCSSSDNHKSSKNGAFPHGYIRERGYKLSTIEEQTICTVYQKTPLEDQEHLRNSLMNYIDWRCGTTDGKNRHVDNSADSLHLCSHINNKSFQILDKDALSQFSRVLENDGITRLDLLWNMRPYKKWFDATPGVLANEVSA